VNSNDDHLRAAVAAGVLASEEQFGSLLFEVGMKSPDRGSRDRTLGEAQAYVPVAVGAVS